MPAPALHRSLSSLEYFAFGFGTMVGVGWLVLIDDWLGRGGPGGAMLGFLIGGLLLLPIAHVYGRLVRELPDASAEVAYAEGVFPSPLAFAAGWMMVLAYAIVCPWEAVAIGNLLARVVRSMDSAPLYQVAGRSLYAPRVGAGLLLALLVAGVNYRGVRPSGLFQDVTTIALLVISAVFVTLGFVHGHAANLQPLFAAPGARGAARSTVMVLQVVPYFMTGFESVAKGSEEARAGFDPRSFSRAMRLAVVAGIVFYVCVVGVVSFVQPWRTIVDGHIGTEAVFERAFGSRLLAQLVLLAAFVSLLKVMNGNFVAATRLIYGMGRRGLVHPLLARVHPRFGTPSAAVLLLFALTVGGLLLGDAALVPIAEVGSIAVGVGWLSTCGAALARGGEARLSAVAGATVSAAIVLMKALPWIPGSLGRGEWIALGGWCALGLVLWLTRRR
jgi:basic amino acid/polyamine antiporter, APA family